jgi:hypothetical protein
MAWQRSVDLWRRKGLTNADIAFAMRTAYDQFLAGHITNPWTYAAAICWNLIDQPVGFGLSEVPDV